MDWMLNCQQYAVKLPSEGSVVTDKGKVDDRIDGLQVTFVSAEIRPDVPNGGLQTKERPIQGDRVRITLSMKNYGSTAPIPLAPGSPYIAIYGGNKRIAMKRDNSWSGSGDQGEWTDTGNGAPTRLVPGSSFEWYDTYIIPPQYRDVIAISVGAGGMDPTYTFTDVEKVLK